MGHPLSHPLLRSRPVYIVAVVLLLVVLACELWLSIRQLSQTMDEAAHTYAGYQYWRARDFGLNPEHPPLVKLVAAVPLLHLTLTQPHPPTFVFKAEEYGGGGQFLYGNNAEVLLRDARRAASVFTFILAFLVFAAAYEMFCPAAALVALFLFVFEPNLLAHGALVTTDMGITCFLFAAVYAFYRYVKHPSLVRLLVCGIATGLALASKFSGLVIVPIFAVCALAEVFFFRNPPTQTLPSTSARSAKATKALHLAGAIVIIGVIAWAVLWASYTFRFQARPGTAQLAPTLAAYAAELHHGPRAIMLTLARWHLLPESYLFGLTDLIQPPSPFHWAWNASFLFGKLYPSPRWFYFPVAFLIKSTLPLLLLLIAFVVLHLVRRIPYRREITYLIVPVVLFFAASINAPLNIGIRHILPVYPFLILMAALGAWTLSQRSQVGAYAVAALLLFQAISSLHAFPNYIAYSNEAFGGPSRTYRVLNDSNADWGQNQKQVHTYLEREKITDCSFADFGAVAVSPAYFGIPCRLLPTGLGHGLGFGVSPVIPPKFSGVLLVSTNEASGIGWGAGDLNPYSQFQEQQPVAVIAGSVLVFKGDFDLPLAAAQSHASLAANLLYQHKFPEALAETQAAAALAPDSPEMQTNLCRLLLMMGRKAEAAQPCQNARDLARTHDPQNFLHTEETLRALQ